MVAFPLNPGNMFPWRHNATMRWATLVLAQISLAGLEDVESGIQVGVFALSLAWIASVACVAIWAAISFARNHFSVIWPLYYLRLTAHLTTTILFLPLSAILMSAFRCEDTWAGTSMTCWGPLHGILVLSTALIVLFMAILSLVVAAVFFDRDMVRTQHPTLSPLHAPYLHAPAPRRPRPASSPAPTAACTWACSWSSWSSPSPSPSPTSCPPGSSPSSAGSPASTGPAPPSGCGPTTTTS